MRQARIGLILLMICVFASGSAPAEESRLMRFPDVHKDMIVFVYAEDLWLVSTEGGMARRLTSDAGAELFPKFSPDGKMIAFTGQYDGNTDVYVIAAEGGEPRRLTFRPGFENMSDRFGYDDVVLDWHPDGKRILFRSARESYNSWFQTLFLIGVEGGFPERLPLPEAGLTSFSPDGSKIAYNRIFRNFRTWGGVVGIRGFPSLLGGGYATVPEFAPFSMEGEWIMENYGVDPDIELDNLPDQVVLGRDPQLEKAIEVIMKKLEEEPKKLPERPAYPVRD